MNNHIFPCCQATGLLGPAALGGREKAPQSGSPQQQVPCCVYQLHLFMWSRARWEGTSDGAMLI